MRPAWYWAPPVSYPTQPAGSAKSSALRREMSWIPALSESIPCWQMSLGGKNSTRNP